MLALLPCAARAEDFFFDSAGVRIHYRVEGKGEPVLLIHGFAANIEVNWGKPGILEALARSYQVIAIDNRGHGQSDKPHEAEAYRGQMAEDVIRLMDHLKIRQAQVVGYSMGGFIALKLLDTHPERLRSAVVGGAGWNPAAVATFQPMVDKLAESLEQGQGLGPLAAMLAPSEAASVGGAEGVEAANKTLIARSDPLALAAALRAMFGDQPAEETLRANQVPVLVVVGEMDLMRSWAETLSRTATLVKLLTIPGANHMSAVTNPRFLAGLQEFLSAHAAKPRPPE